MEIKRIYPTNKKLTASEMYRAVKSNSAVGISKCDIELIAIDYVVFYSDVEKKTGELREVVSIVTPQGETYTTNSPYFTETLNDMLTIFEDAGEAVHSIKVLRQKAKSGRSFIDCDFAE